MRKVAHPEKLYIQINDECEYKLGFSFNDDETNPEGLDPNAFDKDTLLRVTRLLANTFMCIERLRTEGTMIKSLNEQECHKEQ